MRFFDIVEVQHAHPNEQLIIPCGNVRLERVATLPQGFRNTDMEVWKPVVGYENAYQVSNYGRLKSVRRLKSGIGRDRIIKCSVERDKGYVRTGLSKDGRTKTIRVHRLVCEAFHGPCPDGMEVLHGDDVKTNNHASNLSWGTRADNIGKLAEPCIHIILAMLAAGHRVADIAARFDLGRRYVYKLKYGEKWAHLPRPYTLGNG